MITQELLLIRTSYPINHFRVVFIQKKEEELGDFDECLDRHIMKYFAGTILRTLVNCDVLSACLFVLIRVITCQLSLPLLNCCVQTLFAEIERMRRRSETNLRGYSARDKMAEAAEQEKVSALSTVSSIHFVLVFVF